MSNSISEAKFPYYWLCHQCATEMGGTMPADACVTAIQGTCKYCKGADRTLIPWVDYNFPSDKALDKKARLARD